VLSCFLSSYAQDIPLEENPIQGDFKTEKSKPEGIVFNLGASAGFNAIQPVINSLSVDDVILEDVNLHYKVGYMASFFIRMNMDRFFIQPSVSWVRSEGDILYSFPPTTPEDQTFTTETSAKKARLTMKKSSIQIPVMIGYNIVGEGPYGLSLMAGPSINYNHKVSYTSVYPDVHEFLNENTPWEVGITAGVAVKVWQLFFDFSYQFGLNKVESDFKTKDPQTTTINNSLRIDKRTNMMSFTLGIVF